MAGVKWSDDAYFTNGGDCQIGDLIMGLRSGSNFKFTFPSTGIKDSNGNFLIAWDTLGISATDYLRISNGSTGTSPAITALGTDTNVGINLVAQGTGQVSVTGLFNINGSTAINSIINDGTMATATAQNIPTAESVVDYVLAHPGGGGYYTWNVITTTSASMVSKNGYIANNGSLVSLLLPSSSVAGDMIALQGKGSGLFKVTQGAGQQIHFGASDTTLGGTGYLESTAQYDSFILVCITDNTDWALLGGSQGNITVF